ncbi:MAG: DUF1801 domain-containing protein [Bacteroidetes bacterium]|nr:DUF1801 domain-containing protein [Bacteroidota bacterium]
MATKPNKTQATDASVATFLGKIADKQQRADAEAIVELMSLVTKLPPHMYGSSIIGFGSYHYVYESGREGDAPLVAFSPRKSNIVFYVYAAVESQAELLGKLGKHKSGKGCVYINKLADVDTKVLKDLVKGAVAHIKKQYPSK